VTSALLKNRLTVTVPEAAELLGISVGSAYEASRSGHLPTLRIGRRLLVPVPRLLALLGADVPEGGSATALTNDETPGTSSEGSVPTSSSKGDHRRESQYHPDPDPRAA
jgi:excisionase family DNA binding protein